MSVSKRKNTRRKKKTKRKTTRRKVGGYSRSGRYRPWMGSCGDTPRRDGSGRGVGNRRRRR